MWSSLPPFLPAPPRCRAPRCPSCTRAVRGSMRQWCRAGPGLCQRQQGLGNRSVVLLTDLQPSSRQANRPLPQALGGSVEVSLCPGACSFWLGSLGAARCCCPVHPLAGTQVEPSPPCSRGCKAAAGREFASSTVSEQMNTAHDCLLLSP